MLHYYLNGVPIQATRLAVTPIIAPEKPNLTAQPIQISPSLTPRAVEISPSLTTAPAQISTNPTAQPRVVISPAAGSGPVVSPTPTSVRPDLDFSTTLVKAGAGPSIGPAAPVIQPVIQPAIVQPAPAIQPTIQPAIQPVFQPAIPATSAPTPGPTTTLAPIPWAPSRLPPTTYVDEEEEEAPATEDRTIIVAPVVSTPTPGTEPFYKTCWFWAIIGAATVGAGWMIKRRR